MTRKFRAGGTLALSFLMVCVLCTPSLAVSFESTDSLFDETDTALEQDHTFEQVPNYFENSNEVTEETEPNTWDSDVREEELFTPVWKPSVDFFTEQDVSNGILFDIPAVFNNQQDVDGVEDVLEPVVPEGVSGNEEIIEETLIPTIDDVFTEDSISPQSNSMYEKFQAGGRYLYPGISTPSQSYFGGETENLAWATLNINQQFLSFAEFSVPFTTVYKVTATENNHTVYSDLFAFDVTDYTDQVITIEGKIPVGAEVTVQLVYSGPSYSLLLGLDYIVSFRNVPSDCTTEVLFPLVYNGYNRQGYGIVNHFHEDSIATRVRLPDTGSAGRVQLYLLGTMCLMLVVLIERKRGGHIDV